ncbi:hypothetical protein CLV87_2778 [Pelagimonas phthalicica]|nr:hypothetical protein CLV87_2778 [Pelagimonas phthalicica]
MEKRTCSLPVRFFVPYIETELAEDVDRREIA